MASKKARIAIFKPGSHRSTSGDTITFSDAHVQEIASTYNTTTYKAPLVVGHPEVNDPAFGWVESLDYSDGVLYANVEVIDDNFFNLVERGYYQNVSASLFRPGQPSHPLSAAKSFYLRHVGFLGAAAPSVKGLERVQFSDGEKPEHLAEFANVAFESRLPDFLGRLTDFLLSYGSIANAREVIPAWWQRAVQREAETDPSNYTDPPPPKPGDDQMTTQTQAELDARQKALDAKESQGIEDDKRRADEQAEIDRIKREYALAENANFVDKLKSDGAILPREELTVTALLSEADTSPANFADADGRHEQISQRDLLKRFLTGLGKRVEYGSTTPPAPPGRGSDTPANYAEEAKSNMQVATQARIYQQKLKDQGIHISPLDAVTAVEDGRA